MKDFVKKAASKISKLTDEQVELLVENLTAENEALTAIAESLSCGIIVVNTEYRIYKHNRAASSCLPFKVRINDSKSKNMPLWDIVDDDDISRFFMGLYETDKTNASEEFSYMVSEKTRFVSITVMPLQTKKLKERVFIITVDDITAKKQQEILLHRNESLSALTRLAGSVAHEIKNPLGAISIHMQLLQKSIKKSRDGDGMLPPENRLEQYINVVNEEIENLNKIVLDFLFATRPLQANLALSSPEALIEKTIAFFKPEFDSKNICIKSNLNHPEVRLLIDDKLLRDVVVNLMQNALHAILKRFPLDCENTVNLEQDEVASGPVVAPLGEENVAGEKIGRNTDLGQWQKIDRGILVIASKIMNGKYVLTFLDNGCGMDENVVSHVFEPYYTTKANGTGLGLTMVYKVMKEFRGDIDVASIPDEGTVFTLTVPLPQKETKLLSGSTASFEEGGHAE